MSRLLKSLGNCRQPIYQRLPSFAMTELLLQGATFGDIFGEQLEGGAVIAVGHSPPGQPGRRCSFHLSASILRLGPLKGGSRTKMVG